MTSDNHTRNREFQQDARAWSTFTGTKYTAALRQMGSPMAQGLLGERVSARRLIAVLDDHELIGARGRVPRLGDNGFSSALPWRFNGETDSKLCAIDCQLLARLCAARSYIQPRTPDTRSPVGVVVTAAQGAGPAAYQPAPLPASVTRVDVSLTRDNRPDGAQLWDVSRRTRRPVPR